MKKRQWKIFVWPHELHVDYWEGIVEHRRNTPPNAGTYTKHNMPQHATFSIALLFLHHNSVPESTFSNHRGMCKSNNRTEL